MNKSKIAAKSNGEGLLAVPNPNSDSLASELPKDKAPQLSVVQDYDLEELASQPDAQPDFSTVGVRKHGAIPEIDLDDLMEATPADTLSVASDFELDEMQVEPEAEVVTKRTYTTVALRPPRDSEFVFVHPTWRATVFLLEPEKWTGRPQLVLPEIARQFPICRKARLVPYANKEGAIFLWRILLENSKGNLSDASDSALDRTAKGAGKWCRYATEKGVDLVSEQKKQDPPPEWPEGGLKYLLNVAFKGSTVRDPEILQERVGEPIK